MTKRILKIFLLLALSAGFYAMTANAKGEGVKSGPTQTAQPSQTATNTPDNCTVTTGINNGTVNLRECEGVSCGAVLDIVTEGERLNIVTAGEWLNVATVDGVTGYINSKYCKVTP